MIDDRAADKIIEYMRTHETASRAGRKALIEYAYAIATKYGEGAAEMACQMYDAVAEISGAGVPAAVPAQTATKGEVAKTINGALLWSDTAESAASAMSRLVKTAGVDTTVKNAIRDGAEWAWVPHGDTCAFCLMLASQGWVGASRKVLKGDHAEHIHNNCDCTFAVRFDSRSTVEGYDPDEYRQIYDNAEGSTWEQKLNSMRRAQYAAKKDAINAQKRAAYAKRRERKGSKISFTDRTNSDTIKENETVPNVTVASIARDKMQNYLLNGDHPVGKNKARVLDSVLGFNQNNWKDLSKQIYYKLQTSTYTKKTETNYGVKYVVPMRLVGNNKSMVVNTVWQVDYGSDVPRLITMSFEMKTIKDE